MGEPALHPRCAAALRPKRKSCANRPPFLGDIAQWMLMNNNRYAFLVSSDEMTFLHMEVRKITFRERTLFYEPWLHYSPPMKIADEFDMERGSVTVRMALLYLFFEV